MTEAETYEQMRNTKPTWQEDGKGVKGDPVLYHSAEALPKFEKSTFVTRPEAVVSKPAGPPLPLGADLPGSLT